MSKKKLDVSGIANELEGSSSFFAPRLPVAMPDMEASPASPASVPQSPPEPPMQVPASSPALENLAQPENIIPKNSVKVPEKRSNDRTNEPQIPDLTQPTDIRTDERTDDRKKERITSREKVRHSFDVFADQLISLRELALVQEKMFGQRVLIGDLVQQAIDMLITKERN